MFTVGNDESMLFCASLALLWRLSQVSMRHGERKRALSPRVSTRRKRAHSIDERQQLSSVSWVGQAYVVEAAMPTPNVLPAGSAQSLVHPRMPTKPLALFSSPRRILYAMASATLLATALLGLSQ